MVAILNQVTVTFSANFKYKQEPIEGLIGEENEQVGVSRCIIINFENGSTTDLKIIELKLQIDHIKHPFNDYSPFELYGPDKKPVADLIFYLFPGQTIFARLSTGNVPPIHFANRFNRLSINVLNFGKLLASSVHINLEHCPRSWPADRSKTHITKQSCLYTTRNPYVPFIQTDPKVFSLYQCKIPISYITN